VVVTGGTAQLRGALELARDVFALPAKVGQPRQRLAGSLVDHVEQPRFSTATGLALHGMMEMTRGAAQAAPGALTLNRLSGSIRRWLTEFF
jgi:cell division protein FtsA